MSIQSEIARTKEYLRESRTAVLDRGGEISATAGLKDLPDAIRSISADTSVVFQTDDSITYTKTVPSNAEPKAMLMSVGGMTKKCNNLVHIPDIEASTTGQDGDTISVYLTDTIFVSAETLATVSSSIWRLKFDYEDGTSNYIVDNVFKSGGGLIKASADNPIVSITYRSTYITEGKYSGFMVSYGTTRVPYEPYYEGLRDSKVTEIVNRGANLIPFPYYNSASTAGGITFTSLGDGGIKVIGTSTVTSTFTLGTARHFKFEHGKQYTLSLDKIGANVSIIICYLDASGVTQYQGISFVWNSAYVLKQIYLQVYPNKTVDTIIYPMLNEGDTALPYTPYREPITYTIPEEITALEGYGEGVPAMQNEIDFTNKRYIPNCKKIIFTGNENWVLALSSGGDTSCYYVGISGLNPLKTDKKHQTNSHFEYGSRGNEKFGVTSIHAGGGVRFYTVYQFPTLEEWVAYVKSQYENGTPITSVISIANPNVVDISTYLADFDNILDVERGGSIEFVNEYGQAVPSSILYTVKVGT